MEYHRCSALDVDAISNVVRVFHEKEDNTGKHLRETAPDEPTET